MKKNKDRPVFVILTYLVIIAASILFKIKTIENNLGLAGERIPLLAPGFERLSLGLKDLSKKTGLYELSEKLDQYVFQFNSLEAVRIRHTGDVMKYMGVNTGNATRVLIIGASSIQMELGAELERRLEESGAVVYRYGKKSTGLNWPERLNWTDKTEELCREFQPDVLIIQFGGNDAVRTRNHLEPGKYENFGTPLWDDLYMEKIGNLIEIFQETGGRDIVLIGMPLMKDASFSNRIRHLNEVLNGAAKKYGALYIPIWDISASEDGEYREYFEFEGRTRPMRYDDGIHFTLYGSRYVSQYIINIFKEKIKL